MIYEIQVTYKQSRINKIIIFTSSSKIIQTMNIY